MRSLWKNRGASRIAHGQIIDLMARRVHEIWANGLGSDATKDRFIAMYHVADKAPTRSRELFSATVLELVKLIQASLAIFGMFDLQPEERNGLLCDVTCDGIQRWVAEIGEPYLNIEVL